MAELREHSFKFHLLSSNIFLGKMHFTNTANAASIALTLLFSTANTLAIAIPDSSTTLASPDCHHYIIDESSHRTLTNADGTVVHIVGATIASADSEIPLLKFHPDSRKEKRRGLDYCGDSPSINHSSGGAPTVADCQCIQNWAADPANDQVQWSFWLKFNWY
jgi:hypothetical protein